MDADRIIVGLEQLGCRRIRIRRNRVWATCPFEENHNGGVDVRPNSFFVDVNPSGASFYHCFACGAHGLVDKLLGMSSSEIVDGISWDRKRPIGGGRAVPRPKPTMDDFKKFSPFGARPEAIRYMESRGFSHDVVESWGARVDDARGRVVFPVLRSDGEFVTATGRLFRDDDGPKWLHYSWDWSKNELSHRGVSISVGDVLFGEWRAAEILSHKVESVGWYGGGDQYVLIVVEGPFDAVAVSSVCDMPVVAALGSTPSNDKMESISRLASRAGGILCLLDGDQAGKKFGYLIAKAMHPHGTKVVSLSCPDGQDPGDVDRRKLARMIERGTKEVLR